MTFSMGVPRGTITFFGSMTAEPSTVMRLETKGIPVLRYLDKKAMEVTFITRQPTSLGSLPGPIRLPVQA